MVDTPPSRPSPPPRKDDMAWKFLAGTYVLEHFPTAAPADYGAWFRQSYDTLEQYLRKCCEAQSEANVSALKFMLDPEPSLRGSDAPQLCSRERADLVKAFSDPYKDERSCVQTFTEFVDKCAVGWDRAIYIAPYTSLVQSSGTGKSRLLKEFANKRYVIYCCVRSKESSGIPARSWIADKLLPAPGVVVDEEKDRRKCSFLYASFICACIDHLAESVKTGITRQQWCEKQLEEGDNVSGGDFWEKIHDRMENFGVHEFKNFESEKQDSQFLQTTIRLSCENLVASCRASKVFNADQVLLTFALDEARCLLYEYGGTSYFSIFRWMASYLKEGCGIFIVLVDTVSKISNFQPATIKDISYRYSKVGGTQLLPPFYTVNTFNILAPGERKWNDIQDSTSDLASLLTSHFMRGRPLFGSYIRSRLGSEVVNDVVRSRLGSEVVKDVVRLAVSKLLGGVPPNDFKDLKVDYNIGVALLSVRAAVFVKPQSELASSLVASHLGMCLAISSDRRSVFTGYPSEPVLAEAACHIMNRRQDSGLGEFLEPLLLYIREGIVEGGVRGELAARLLFLLAWDHACMKDALAYTPRLDICGGHRVLYTRPLTVRQFLHSLADEQRLHAALKGQIADREMQRFLDGKVFFTHFTAVTYRVERPDLIEFFESSAAVMCKRGEQSIDLIIPVRLRPGVMSYILVQVRNYRDADPKYKWASVDVTPESAGLEKRQVDYPYLALYLSLGYRDPRVYNLKYEKHHVADLSAVPLAKRYPEEPTEEPIQELAQEPKRTKKRKRSLNESSEDPFQMIIGLFSLQPAIYPCLRGDQSTSSTHLSSLSRAWTDILDYVQNNKTGGLGEDQTMRDAKSSFVKETCTLNYK